MTVLSVLGKLMFGLHQGCWFLYLDQLSNGEQLKNLSIDFPDYKCSELVDIFIYLFVYWSILDISFGLLISMFLHLVILLLLSFI